MTAARMRNAIVWAVTLEVHCPFCKRPQPNLLGAYTWLPEQVRRGAGLDCSCPWCSRTFVMTYANRVNVLR
jgi:uncharacterized Zn-finger protein